jgi:L-iditol 2-dehydrogenase
MSAETMMTASVIVDHDGDKVTVAFGLTAVSTPGPHELRVKPTYIGICGSDLEIVRGNMPDTFAINYPHTMGHEWSGVVESIGAEVTAFAVGDRVLGHGDLGNNHWFGVTHNGAAQEEFLVPAGMCFAVPAGVDMLTAAIIEPFACVLNGMRRIGGVDAAQTVHIYGLGAIGLAAVIQCVVAGARVIALDPSKKRRELALRLGATAAFDPSESMPLVEKIEAETGRGNADLVIEASGASSAQASALESADQNARVLFMGLSRAQEHPTRVGLIQSRNLTVAASTGAPVEIWEPAIRFVAQAGIDLGVIVSSILPFERCSEAFDRAANSREEIKVMLASKPVVLTHS